MDENPGGPLANSSDMLPEPHRDHFSEPPTVYLVDQGLYGDYWTDIEGRRWKLEDMEPQHQINVLAFIRERSIYLYLAHRIQEELFDPYDRETRELSYVSGGMLQWMVRVDLDMHTAKGTLPRIQADAKEWVEEQHMVKRLKALTKEDNRVAFVERMKARLAKRD